MRGLILQIHLALALVAGTFMALLGVTGSIMAFEPELDRLLHPGLSYVQPQSRILSLVEIGDAVSREYSGEPIVAFLPSTTPNFPTEVILSRGIVSVDQYTGKVLGIRTRGQSFLGVVRSLHVRLGSGDVGRGVLKWSAVAMVFSLVSGLYLWWPGKRVRIRAPLGSRGSWIELHNSLGILLLLPLLVLAVTGCIIGFEEQMSSILDKMYGTSPGHFAQTQNQSEPAENPREITPDQAVAIANVRLPGAIAYRVQMPRYGGRYVVAMTDPAERIFGDHNSISIDQWRGTILVANLSKDLTARERFMATNEAIHTGNILGTPSRIVAALAGIFLPLQFGSGFLMWIYRRRLTAKKEVVGGVARA